MALRFGVIFVAVLVVLTLSWESEASLVRREAPSTTGAPAQGSHATKAIEDAFESFKSGVGDFVKNVQENDFVQDVTKAFKDFGNSVQKKGEELATKFKNDEKNHPAQ